MAKWLGGKMVAVQESNSTRRLNSAKLERAEKTACLKAKAWLTAKKCDGVIPEPRRKAIAGVRFVYHVQSEAKRKVNGPCTIGGKARQSATITLFRWNNFDLCFFFPVLINLCRVAFRNLFDVFFHRIFLLDLLNMVKLRYLKEWFMTASLALCFLSEYIKDEVVADTYSTEGQ